MLSAERSRLGMIVCHCNLIRRDEIVDAVKALLGRGGTTPPTPHGVYRELKNSGKCCGCFPAVESLISNILAETGDDPIASAEAA